MKFNFKIQQYQTDAVDAVVKVFQGQGYHDRISYIRDLGKQQANQQLAIDDLNIDDTGYKNEAVQLSDELLLGNIQKIVSKGLAVAVLPRRIWQQDDANPYNLTTVDIAQANTHVEAGMIYRSSLLSTAEKRIMELLQEICGQAG